MVEEEFDGIVLRERERSLFMSRVPKQTKEEFVSFANSDFCEDYGMTFKYVWDNFKLWKVFFENIDMKLDIILNKLEIRKEESDKDITLLSGRKIKGGKKNGST